MKSQHADGSGCKKGAIRRRPTGEWTVYLTKNPLLVNRNASQHTVPRHTHTQSGLTHVLSVAAIWPPLAKCSTVMFNVVCCNTRRECRQCMHDIVTINSRANIPVVERLVYFTYEPPVPFDSNVSAERHFR